MRSRWGSPATIVRVESRLSLLGDRISSVAYERRQTACVGMSGGGLAVFHRGTARVLDQASELPGEPRVGRGPPERNSVLFQSQRRPLHRGEHATTRSTGLIPRVDARRFKMASNRALTPRGPLDGGAPYGLTSILPDEERKALWLGCLLRRR